MPQTELRLTRSDSENTQVSAWFCLGKTPKQWLQEICNWPLEHDQIRLVVIRSMDDQGIEGALLIPPTNEIARSGQCVPYQRVGANVYLPIDASIFPPVSVQEIELLFDEGYIHVWTPTCGLTSVERSSLLRPSDLIDPSGPSSSDWDLAVPGVAFPSRIRSITPEQSYSSQHVIEGGKENIGERADELKNIPKRPGGSNGKVSNLAKQAIALGAGIPLLGLAKLVSTMGKLFPRRAPKPTRQGRAVRRPGQGGVIPSMFKNLGKLANRLATKISKTTDDMRHRSIKGLLKMLEDDPDQGLRYAIPMSGDAHRGKSDGGSQLGVRDPNFSLSRLGGGAPANIWDISWEYQERLIVMYREMASREIGLGRHRRAAYIFAELLGDFASAASVLKDGGHFREAAVLYRERLNDRQTAAACLEEGELWNEAIEAYRDLNQWEKIGDLLTHLERLEDATDAYQRAVDRCLEKNDFLDAARVYEEKMKSFDLALMTLDSSWPNSSQAAMCVRKGFEILGRLGKHNDAKNQIDWLADNVALLNTHATVAELLSDVFEGYPETQVGEYAVTSARKVIANRIRHASQNEVSQLTTALARLNPSDQLLRRDGRTYLKELMKNAPSNIRQSRAAKNLVTLEQFELGSEIAWTGTTSIDGLVYVAGVRDNRVVFARCGHGVPINRCNSAWPFHYVASNAQLLLNSKNSNINVFPMGDASLPPTTIFLPGESLVKQAISAGTPAGHKNAWGVAQGNHNQIWSVEIRDDPALVCYSSDGSLISSTSLSWAIWESASFPFPIHALKDRVLLGINNELFEFKKKQFTRLETFASRIMSISGGNPYALAETVLSLEVGAALVQLSTETKIRSFVQDMETPKVFLNPGNFLVAADANRIAVFRKESSSKRLRLSLLVEETHELGRPVSLLSTQHTDQFAMVAESGVVAFYKI